jgi:hypothetical protein
LFAFLEDIHTYFWLWLQRFRDWESYVVRKSNIKTKPRRKTKINKIHAVEVAGNQLLQEK